MKRFTASSGIPRRLLLQAGVATAAAAALPQPAPAAGAADEPDWRRYVVGPADRHVTPSLVTATTGDVRDPDALLTRGGTVTVLTRPRPTAPPQWPAGTTATASSFHAPNGGNNGTPTTYEPGNAVDADPGTFWNDAEPATYPAVLTITTPTAQTLPGVTLLSNADGVPVDFTVETWDGTAWQPAATVTGNSDVQRAVPFGAAVTTGSVRLTVTRTQDTPRGQYTRVNALWPGVVEAAAAPSVTVDFGKVVVGYPRVVFAWASDNNPGVRLAFSETLQFLTDRSDYTRGDGSGGPGTDQYAVPAGGADWLDQPGDQSGTQVHAEGLHGFRYLKITLDALPADAPAALPYGQVAIDAVALEFTAYLGTPESYAGTFLCSDDELNRYWYAASYAGELTVDTFRATDCDPRDAASPTLEGKLVLHDGAKRDRDPYVGDLAVSGRTLYLTHPDAAVAARNVLADLAAHQRSDGFLPPASIVGYALKLFDYPLWWITTSWDYVLYTGDRAYAADHWTTLTAVLDTWYPSVTDGDGLLSKGLNATGEYGDYAFLPRSGRVTYYNVLYVQALRDAARIAGFLGYTADADRWTRRAATVTAAVNAKLWDATAGAYLDTLDGPVRHGQDGNSLAITADVADPARAASALRYLDATTRQPYGNAFMDNNTLPGVGGASERVYAFTSYPEIVARFRTGAADSAIDQIKRTYGWMAAHDPGSAAWEGIGPGGKPYEDGFTSMVHGWSTGVLPALTNELLGVTPTGPGFTTWTLEPHPGTTAWAQGTVPTPHGPLTVSWQRTPSTFTLRITAPTGTRGQVVLPAQARTARTTLNGAAVPGRTVRDIGPGTHTIVVR
ncbi:alpha-L-rhamnosidase C-terminal domain-containing protein [Winogradskya consettensis]|uniref:Alpha-L-rhamnosidase n=1 Tax=Winogradskya consettensis TaxID=113560 RepID=A0A919SB23_9ACTN|nr:alpha-L-rhamnosidase C-terminal domain-containing protein [Actinoplanes consettensis]GIM68254.1 alpha-L-rhamnosidase [Actinoplanes consettensis]